MSKYAALFNSHGTRSDTAASTAAAAAAASPSTGTSSPLSSSTMNTPATAATAAVEDRQSADSSSHLSSCSSSPRNRLVRRRRDGGVASGNDASTASASANNSSNIREEGISQEGLSSTSPLQTGASQAPSGVSFFARPEKEPAAEAAPPLFEVAQGHDVDAREGSPSRPNTLGASATEDTFGDAEDDAPQLTEASPATSASAAPSSSSLSAFSHPPEGFFTCDACMHFVASSYRDLERHALELHGDALADYTRLRTVAEKLVPVWSQVLARKQDVIQRWGEEVFRVAVQRDAGAAKMAEAHRARAQLELVVQRWHPNARVFIFGSSVAFGVWDGMSDIDFTVVDVAELEAGMWPPSEKNAVRTITELLRRAGFSFINLEPISHARVPIIKHHASLPIQLTAEQRRCLRQAAHDAAAAATGRNGAVDGESSAALTSTLQAPSSSSDISEEDDTQLEAELVIARSVRYTLNLPASALDSAVLEASIRLAVGSAAVQQVWWNRTREMCCMTFDTTTSAMSAATCPLHFVSAGMRARVQPLHEECRPELYGMDFDLSFRAFGIRNSHLLRRYLLSHPCARPGALVLKDWSKSSGVNNSMNGYLTSYAINIMWIYYLVHHNVIPYVSPTEDIPASLRGNVSGDPEYAAMVDPAWTAEQRAAMQAQAGELLLGFFYYYAFDFDWDFHVVSLNRPGVTTKAMLGWAVEDVAVPLSGGGPMDGAIGGGGLHPPGPQQLQQNDLSNVGGGGGGAAAARRNRSTTRYSFCIEDPYEENLNLGRHMGITKTLRVQTELYRGLLSLLKDDVHECCVFAGASRAEEKRTGGGGGGDGTGTGRDGAEPAELPLRVLYRLMAIATREVATAKAAHSANTPAHANNNNNNQPIRDFPGIPLAQLTAAFEARAPAEWAVACNAWNVQQLLHRLGLKIHGGTHVLPRREVGLRRLASLVPTGVVFATAPEPTVVAAASALPSSSASSPSPSTDPAPAASMGSEPSAFPQTTAELAEMNNLLMRPLRAQHFSSDLMMAVAQGYECLTPAWVAWSKPWAALSAWWTDRRQALSASSATASSNGGRSKGPSMSSPSAAAAAASPHPRVSALPEQAIGAMHQTRKQLLHNGCTQGVRRGATTGAAALSSGVSRRNVSGFVWRAPARPFAASPPAATAAALSSSPPSFRRAWRVRLR